VLLGYISGLECVLYGVIVLLVLFRGRAEDMPRAVSIGHTQRYDLKSVPEGYVVIRRLTHGEKAERQMLNNKMTMKATRGKKDVDSEIILYHRAIDLYNFAHCITEHNLQDENDRPLDFTNVSDVNKIDAKISEEIATYIDKENNFEDDTELENS
jgi:hypothetical protein